MTKKRFLLKKCNLYDMEYNKDVPIATFRNVDDAKVICSWLNELYNENEQLRQIATRTEEEKEEYADLYNEYRKENEQLRQEVAHWKHQAEKLAKFKEWEDE